MQQTCRVTLRGNDPQNHRSVALHCKALTDCPCGYDMTLTQGIRRVPKKGEKCKEGKGEKGKGGVKKREKRKNGQTVKASTLIFHGAEHQDISSRFLFSYRGRTRSYLIVVCIIGWSRTRGGLHPCLGSEEAMKRGTREQECEQRPRTRVRSQKLRV